MTAIQPRLLDIVIPESIEVNFGIITEEIKETLGAMRVTLLILTIILILLSLVLIGYKLTSRR